MSALNTTKETETTNKKHGLFTERTPQAVSKPLPKSRSVDERILQK